MLQHDELCAPAAFDQAGHHAAAHQLTGDDLAGAHAFAHPAHGGRELGLTVGDQLVEGDTDLPGSRGTADECGDHVHQLDAEAQSVRGLDDEGEGAVGQWVPGTDPQDDGGLGVSVGHRSFLSLGTTTLAPQGAWT